MPIPALFFDLETIANPAALALLPEPKAPGNIKDPAKIAAAIAEKKAAQIEKAALDPDTGKIRAIGLRSYGADTSQHTARVLLVPPLVTANLAPQSPEAALIDTLLDDAATDASAATATPFELCTEAEALAAFWKAYAMHNGRSCGFNIINFDFVFLLRRSLALGVRPTWLPDLRRYQTQPTTDIMALLYNWDVQGAKGLKTICKMYGIANPLPDLDGSQVATMDDATVAAYVANDVNLTVALYEKMAGIYFSA